MIQQSKSQEYLKLLETINSISALGPREFYTITEACTMLGVSRTTLYYMRVNGSVESRRITAKKVVITKRSIDKLVFEDSSN